MSLKDRLAQRGIVCAHIIDDAYDSVPSYALTAEAVQQIFEVAEEEDLYALSNILGLDGIDEAKIRERLQLIEEIQKLFERRAEVPKSIASALFDPFDRDTEGKKRQLDPLIELLEANGIKCLCFGAHYAPQGSDEPQLFFVDLKLKEGTADVANHGDAVRAYKQLKMVHPQCHPFVFLMSSLTSQLRIRREQFRRDADLFQSEFEDIDKAQFANGTDLSLVLANYTRAMPQLSALRDDMNQVQGAVDEATKNVMRELRSLDLADYFVLYHNTTSIEKVRLGPYVVEMLLEFLAHEVEGQEQIWNLAETLDALNLEELPRARFGLTLAAARLYSANMLHSNAMLLAEDKMKQGPSQGYFFTGDIFFEAQSLNLPVPTKALAIVTPACDLVRPEQLKGRSILLCEGSVREMEQGTSLIGESSQPLVVMKHPRVDDRFIVIEWNRKKLHIWDDKERAKFAAPEECSYVRVGRLRPVYALQLQDAITSDLGRIGTQKPPNTIVPHGVRCFVSDGNTWQELFVDLSLDAAALSTCEDKDKKYTTFVLSDPTLQKALSMLKAWIAERPHVEEKASLEKILEETAREALRGFKQRVPQKAQIGKPLDISAYPFADKWGNSDSKLVAIVPGVNCASPYSQIATGHKYRKDGSQPARFVFRLEPTVEPDAEATTIEPATVTDIP